MSIADKLHVRLVALGCDVFRPERIWLGKAHDHSDLWRWQAAERISRTSFIGSPESMQECLAMSDDELRVTIESGQTGRSYFYPSYDQFAAACRRLKENKAALLPSRP